jgi:hypothetical protein
MTRACELFESFRESDSYVLVELGVGTKHVIKGSGIVPFQMDSKGLLRVMDVLWVPELRKSVLSVSTIEKRGLDVLFEDGQALIKPRGYSSDTTTILGVRESNLYRIKGQLMRAMASNKVTEDKEQVAPKVENLRRSQPSGLGGKDQPSNFVKKESQYKMVMQDAQKQEASRSMFKGSESSKTGPSEMIGIHFVSKGETDQVDWRESMVVDLVAKIEPHPGGRSTFLAKREC